MNTMLSLTHGSVCSRCLLAIPNLTSVGFMILAASASLSFLDTWFLALIMIRLAWRTAQTVN